jgi:sodium-coupled neutral amino acid transporter 11
VDAEPKSSVARAAFNLINTIVGAGIVGIPYAIRECSLVWGVFMVLLCALLTGKLFSL